MPEGTSSIINPFNDHGLNQTMAHIASIEAQFGYDETQENYDETQQNYVKTQESHEVCKSYSPVKVTSPLMSNSKIQQSSSSFEMNKILPAMKTMESNTKSKSRWERCCFNWCSMAHYQKYFEVSTEEVFKRGKRALIPTCFTKPFYLVNEKPDLYGPFWICTTLVILLASASNFTEWIYFKPTEEHPVWRANFAQVIASICLLYSEITIVPLIVWMAMKYSGKKKPFAEIISLYGYSLVTFIPNLIFCMITLESVQWISIILTYLLSVSFLLRNITHNMLKLSDGEPATMMELAKIVRSTSSDNNENDPSNLWNGEDMNQIDLGFDTVDGSGDTSHMGSVSKRKFKMVLLVVMLLQAFCFILKLYFFY